MGCCSSSDGEGSRASQSSRYAPVHSSDAGDDGVSYKAPGYSYQRNGQGVTNGGGVGGGAGAGAGAGVGGDTPQKSFTDLVDPGDDIEVGTDANLERKKSLNALKTHKKGTRRYLLHQKIRKTFEDKQMRLHEIVKLPPGEDLNEWISVHVIDFYNDISLLYGTVSELCTQMTCPVMSAGSHTYLWADGLVVTTPVKVPAKEYVQYLMNWVDDRLSDESLFPSDESVPFRPTFVTEVRDIFKRLFRVYAHLYHSHFSQFVDLGVQQHLNLCFKRFVFFLLEFNLVADKELAPLKLLISKLKAQAYGRKAAS